MFAAVSTTANQSVEKPDSSGDLGGGKGTDQGLVLIVDDNSDHRELCRRLLRKQSYRIEFAESGLEAIQICHSLKPDCMLLDFRLPDTDGLGVLEELNANSHLSDIPVVMLTAAGDQRTAVQAMRAGAVDYLRKDEVTRESLSRTVRFAMQRGSLQRIERRLQEAERLAAIGQLAAGVAHEINNPAAFVLNNLTVALDQVMQLKSEPDAAGRISGMQMLDELEECIKDSLDGIRRISGITKDLSELAHPGPRERTRLNLLEVSAQSVKLLKAKAAGRCALIVRPTNLPSVLADRGQLMQAVMNLVDNAIAAIPPGAPRENWVRISAAFDQDHVRLSVEDSGAGISQEIAARVFEPFFTTKPAGKGTGLGLALTRSIARQHDGDLVFESLVRGTRFSLVLPREPRDGTPSFRPPSVHATPTGGKVLLIDDERAVLRSLKRVLQKHYEVFTATDAVSAYRAAEQECFDVVLCDLSMPDISGVEVYHKFARVHPELAQRMLFLSAASVSDELRSEAAKTQCPVLSKPIEATKLIDAIELHKICESELG